MAITYIHGDLAIYTGKSVTLYGGLFYEVLVTEGHMKGQIKHTSKPPQPDTIKPPKGRFQLCEDLPGSF